MRHIDLARKAALDAFQRIGDKERQAAHFNAHLSTRVHRRQETPSFREKLRFVFLLQIAQVDVVPHTLSKKFEYRSIFNGRFHPGNREVVVSPAAHCRVLIERQKSKSRNLHYFSVSIE